MKPIIFWLIQEFLLGLLNYDLLANYAEFVFDFQVYQAYPSVDPIETLDTLSHYLPLH